MVVGDPGPDNVLEVVLPDEFPIGPGGRREPVRHANPFRDQGADQLAKRGILATDISNVARAKITEPAGERLVTRHDPSLSRTRHPEVGGGPNRPTLGLASDEPAIHNQW